MRAASGWASKAVYLFVSRMGIGDSAPPRPGVMDEIPTSGIYRSREDENASPFPCWATSVERNRDTIRLEVTWDKRWYTKGRIAVIPTRRARLAVMIVWVRSGTIVLTR